MEPPVICEPELMESIKNVVKKLGVGLCDPVPYETAWVARVPSKDDLKSPAFPLSLQWLRDNQEENGSWGPLRPVSPYSSTLNTLAAVTCFAQWNYPEDKLRIERGVKALRDLAPKLPEERHKGIGFEVILPAILEEAAKFELLNLPYEDYDKAFNKEKTRGKRDRIIDELKKHNFSKQSSWWYNLEASGKILHDFNDGQCDEDELCLPMLLENGSIVVSPSATAYLLRSARLNGRDIEKADKYLQRVYSLCDQGGIPHLFPIDTFELGFSLDYFLKAGFSAKDPLFAESIERLSKCCTPREAISFSSECRLVESDDAAVSMYVLLQAGHKDESIENLLTYFNGDYFLCFVNEMNFSISANINILRFLRVYQQRDDRDDDRIKEIIKTVANFLENSIFSTEGEQTAFVNDKWHISPYYVTSRAVFSLHGLKDTIVQKCIEYFEKGQNADGGWGRDDDFSTAEESALVVLALCFARKNGLTISEGVLENARKFLFGENSRPDAQLWISKVLYRPTLVSESTVLAAKYALAQTFRNN